MGLLARTTSHPASHPSGRHVKGWTQSVVQHASFGMGKEEVGQTASPDEAPPPTVMVQAAVAIIPGSMRPRLATKTEWGSRKWR